MILVILRPCTLEQVQGSFLRAISNDGSLSLYNKQDITLRWGLIGKKSNGQIWSSWHKPALDCWGEEGWGGEGDGRRPVSRMATDLPAYFLCAAEAGPPSTYASLKLSCTPVVQCLICVVSSGQVWQQKSDAAA